MKNVPIVFRFVNNYDAVTKIPACKIKNGRCKSEFGKFELDKRFNDYAKKYNGLNSSKKKKFYPFHIGGVVLTKKDLHLMNCSNKSEVKENDRCNSEGSAQVKFHTIYYGYPVSSVGKPEAFPYIKRIVRGALALGKEKFLVFKKYANSKLTKFGSSITNMIKWFGFMHKK
jgi:hypothetical protein